MIHVTIGDLLHALRSQNNVQFDAGVSYGCWAGDGHVLGIGEGYDHGHVFPTTYSLADSIEGSLRSIYFDERGDQFIMGYTSRICLADFGSSGAGERSFDLLRIFSNALEFKQLREES